MNKDFYPTPKNLISKMYSKVKNIDWVDVLEPSAGKGDICDYLKSIRGTYRECKIDTIEIEKDLQLVLKGKGYAVVHDDFLTFNSEKRYDLIIANFPFSEGDRHLLRAIELQKRNGGEIVALVNAETIKNPFSNLRQYLIKELTNNNAEIEYLQDEFLDAERKTGVEVALISLTLQKEDKESILLTKLKNEQRERQGEEFTELAETDPIKSLVAQFNLELKIGISIIQEYTKLKKYFSTSLGDIIELSIRNNKWNSQSEDNLINHFTQAVRHKYWGMFLKGDNITSKFTSNIREELYSKLEELKNYDFTEYNISVIFDELSVNMNKSVEDTILKLFEELSHQYSYGYNKDFEKNVHYFSGWKTNKSWKINERVIIPFYSISNYDGKIELYKVRNKMTDILKSLNYLEKDLVNVDSKINELVKQIDDTSYANVDFHYFTATFYKKGTCHIKFKNKELLDKLNIFGSQKKGWLPPTYGKKAYSDMTAEEQSVVNEFQGREEYEKIMLNKDYYLANQTLLLN
jgi:hypothetical protein